MRSDNRGNCQPRDVLPISCGYGGLRRGRFVYSLFDCWKSEEWNESTPVAGGWPVWAARDPAQRLGDRSQAWPRRSGGFDVGPGPLRENRTGRGYNWFGAAIRLL